MKFSIKKILILFTFLSVFILFFFSGFFALDTKNVELSLVSKYISKKDIKAVTKNIENKHLLFISTNNLKDDLKKIPGVKDAIVQKHWPSGLDIIIYNSPICTQKQYKNMWYPIDDLARSLPSQKNKLLGVPVFTGNKNDTANILEINKIILKLPKDLKKRIQSFSSKTGIDISAKIGNITVLFGDTSDIDIKIEDLKIFLKNPKFLEKKTIINLTSPTRPTIK